jgi:histidinol dehydrogenase
MRILEFPKKETWRDLTLRPQLDPDGLEQSVSSILTRVRVDGDQALIDYARQFDGVTLQDVIVGDDDYAVARDLPGTLRDAIRMAAANIEKFHAAQGRDHAKVETMPGVVCWQRQVPIEKIGLYVPGGSAPLFSTVLMLGIPARLAGCRDIVLCSPPDRQGKIDPSILFAAQLVGVSKIAKVGGAQAIAAMAFGTQSIPSVHKIFGPGNQYVTKAKQLVSRYGTAIDMPAGPSEVLVIADALANPAFVAADLLSQAEHGADSQVLLVTRDAPVIPKVLQEIDQQLLVLPRKEVAQKALAQSLAIVFSSQDDMVGFVNEYAPEHLIINTSDCDMLAEEIRNAGSVFLGPWSPESAGDYASGTNHTLPTGGFAKAYSGISLESFSKTITFQKISELGIRSLGPAVEVMATAEKLEGHRNSISVRLKSLS